ncbi:MAG: hypothetical protein WJ289_05570 [Ferrovum myxofaciens]|uniref:hypothetical protein n=1 Tax=Ferrovum myxofaciens TaxID=416213 RepID=UPI001AF7F727|nr:hypothetical protein [Ferrovum myxofaciens]QKE37342.1 MAG: hypothetical protein HO273_00220 [Ferrovum myxofaciens]QWY74991.1 MAG: hypothetical protein JVY19_00670 [Ferrovum myxofaciens]
MIKTVFFALVEQNMGLPDADTAVILITDKHEPDVMIADGFHSVMHLCVADIVQPDIDNAKAIIDFAATRNCSHLLVYRPLRKTSAFTPEI